jgi:short-subunit dehydrogenase
MQIQKKKILITGANRGIGKALSLEAAARGADLILVNRTSNAELLEECKKAGAHSAKEILADLGSSDGLKTFFSITKNLSIDILVNNAGQLTGGALEDQSAEEIDSMLHVNVNALIQITRHFLPKMKKQGSGKIVNNASVSAYMYFPGASTYAAGKAAVAAFSECMKTELQGSGVSVLLLVTPGIETRMFREIPKKYGNLIDTKFLKSIPPEAYAKQVCDAIEADVDTISPKGLTGISLGIAKHLPAIFRKIATARKKENG